MAEQAPREKESPTAERSLPRGRWLLAWFVGWAVLGGAMAALTTYLAYTPSDAPLDLGRAGLTEMFAVLGLLLGLGVAFVTALVFVIYRMFAEQ